MPSSFTWPILEDAAPSTAQATPLAGVNGAPQKTFEIKQRVPSVFDTSRASVIGGVLHAAGLEDHRLLVGDRAAIIEGVTSAGSIRYVALLDDPALTVQHVFPASFPSTLSITVTGKAVAVNLATGSGGNITTTPADVIAAIAASTSASALLLAQALGVGDGPVKLTREPLPLQYDGAAGARADMLLTQARGEDLTVIGENFGVYRPVLLSLSDAQFRLLIAALAYERKLTITAIERVLTIIYGDAATAGWATYELGNKTLIIELPTNVLSRKPASGTYLRSAATASTAPVTGDYLRANATQGFQPPAAPVHGDPASDIPNNSVYIGPSANGGETLRLAFKLVKAAGVKIIFKSRTE